MANLGISFLDNAGESVQETRAGSPIQFLSLQLPRIVGPGGIAPQQLLQAPGAIMGGGGGGFSSPLVDSVVGNVVSQIQKLGPVGTQNLPTGVGNDLAPRIVPIGSETGGQPGAMAPTGSIWEGFASQLFGPSRPGFENPFEGLQGHIAPQLLNPQG